MRSALAGHRTLRIASWRKDSVGSRWSYAQFKPQARRQRVFSSVGVGLLKHGHGTGVLENGREQRHFYSVPGRRLYKQRTRAEKPASMRGREIRGDKFCNEADGSMDGDGAGKEENKRRNGFGPNDKLAHAGTKGKLLTTPSRLFKLLIPLPTNHQKDVEAIAILVHSQQPLSYLERLIQAEVPLVKGRDGQKRPPAISFIVLQFEGDSIRPRSATHEDAKFSARSMGEVEEIALAVGPEPTELKSPSKELGTCSNLRRGKPDPESADERYVRWSHATEIGDFIRDAVRAGEFIIAIEGEPAGLSQIKVTVPSFEERTYFLRMRLRKIAGRIQKLAEIKHECDILAHRGAQRVAIGGFGILASWWYLVYRLTFETDLGWDTMEPVTYLASLSTLMGGYLWFLYHNREISYRSAMDFTINARQKKLYQQKGLDLQLWESLIDEGNALRREIKTIAADYETEWNEKLDERDERVTEALRQERKQKKDDSKQEEGKRSDT